MNGGHIVGYKVDANKVQNIDTDFKFIAKAVGYTYRAYEYQPSESDMQNVALLEKVQQKEDLISGFSLIDSTCASNDNNLTLFNCGCNNVEYYDDEAKEHFIIPVNISNTQSLNLRKYNKNLTVI